MFFASVLLTSCGSSDESDIKAVCEKQIEAINKEKVDDLISTLDSGSPYYETSMQLFEQIFRVYDLEVTLDNMKIVKIKNKIAEVEMTLTTVKKAGPEFTDNKAVSLNILKKTEAGWKFVESRSKSMDPLK